MVDKFILLKKRWKKSNLPPVFYHTTFAENVPLILKEQKIIANRGKSICKEKNGLVSFYRKNRLIAPKNYGSSSDIRKYDEIPLFENEWVIPKELKFDLSDINKALLITSRNLRESAFKDVIKALRSESIYYSFLSERRLSDKDVTDMTSYLIRIRGWKKFNRTEKYV